ncbi:MAG: hypothetical protein ACTHMU_08145 [Thermomicrobiales bacterium]
MKSIADALRLPRAADNPALCEVADRLYAALVALDATGDEAAFDRAVPLTEHRAGPAFLACYGTRDPLWPLMDAQLHRRQLARGYRWDEWRGYFRAEEVDYDRESRAYFALRTQQREGKQHGYYGAGQRRERDPWEQTAD